MPHYTVLVGPQGPLLQVQVGVTAPRRAALQAAGQVVPGPVLAQLLIDTGASISSIDATVIAQLGLQPTGSLGILTPSTGNTPHQCSTYDVELTITGPSTKHFPAMAVIDGNYVTQGHQGLIGRDVLAEGRIIYSGPDGAVLLSF